MTWNFEIEGRESTEIVKTGQKPAWRGERFSFFSDLEEKQDHSNEISLQGDGAAYTYCPKYETKVEIFDLRGAGKCVVGASIATPVFSRQSVTFKCIAEA